MNPKLIAIFLIIVLLPFGVIVWLGIEVDRNQRQIVRHRFDELLTQRLSDIDNRIAKVVQARERLFEEMLKGDQLHTESIRALVRRNREIRQMFVLGSDGKLRHPPAMTLANKSEREFIERTKHIWERGEAFYRPSDSQKTRGTGETSQKENDRGWYTFYAQDGVNFIFWKRDPQGQIIGIEFDRLILLADIIGELPNTEPGSNTLRNDRIQLVDTSGLPIYLWGLYEPAKDEPPRVKLELSTPLKAFRLHYYVSPEVVIAGIGGGVSVTAFISIIALLATVLMMSVYFFRESSREAREAQQRVTFVNQVSHELKTPLTNIRMYAELLEELIDENDEKQREHLNVIVSESQRLSRLIGNVLTFGRQQRDKLMIRRTSGRIDHALATIVDQFRPGLISRGFEISEQIESDDNALFDADALGQIVGNLLSNVEKYAVAGGWVEIRSRRISEKVFVYIQDKGPGIPLGQWDKIFKPFFRLSEKIADGVSGTGIGLSIARTLARLHGGELKVVRSDNGALFELTLFAPLAKGDIV